MKSFLKILLVMLVVLLSGCSTTSEGNTYADQQPTLSLPQYFNGTLDAWGMFQDRSGKVVKRFTVVIQCKWEGDTGTLDEDFTYSDGTKQRRIWTLKKIGPNKFTGTAADIVGEAIGITDGNTLRWKYVLALPVNGHTINVSFDDLMVQMDQRIMLNHAVMSKFGFKVGDISLSFTKRP
ncbi:DUF3833 domain-containing protein [Glaciimonas sp. PAMC28666]|uniref:DUF3833 domain-containing protein n=1 Tax=Glaciimonas sp. PAMC28666 TaxID=2807626 RepID=UPI00196260AF|nr:DUF3833 domain-containing protein [Glaciimonas sp. PAMC28666]QRX83942.1 DUF3833 domain-containing protein [Glaciimonas sp. PAMC28666]